MKITNEEILKGLINIFKINRQRIEVYCKLSETVYTPELQQHFKTQVDESTSLLNELNPILYQSLENPENPVLYEDSEIDQSVFYFGMARASNNIRTVMISCQFGDEFLIKTYQRVLGFLEVNHVSALNDMLSGHLKSIGHTDFNMESMFSCNLTMKYFKLQ
ncbi:MULTISPECIES: hypothetical protein [unclassified Arcicella]|uniref:hypothetical protein n=1 Tax=unclassified Arcicella TaxID=2644986 RepID=UPI00285F1BE4|nr:MULTISPECIES: hypothetical protein [unclassified Arcicella]MDR6560908.1 hypothetical protein [Arcicella sp. BE51]MDR6810792.1 hypothetical protein [Arcicella sp. BE140]MDR6822142.1 hypothetical protein [Arcicella sp. BE139]